LIFEAVIPGGGIFESGEFEDDNFFDCGAVQDSVAAVEGAKFARVLLRAGRN
jgi:hypothetical protein